MITLDEVSFAYPSGPDILRGVSLEVEPGSFQFLTGPSGAGKSTFLKLCCMSALPGTGEIHFFGRDVRALSRDEVAQMRRRIGVMHQTGGFLDHLSVRDNIGLPMLVAGKAKDSYETDLGDLISWVGLTHRADARPPELSGGELQRAALARAVIASPEIIIADEPTGNLDWDMSLQVLRLLLELNRLGKAVIIATHDLNLIRSAKAEVNARVLRLISGELQVAGGAL